MNDAAAAKPANKTVEDIFSSLFVCDTSDDIPHFERILSLNQDNCISRLQYSNGQAYSRNSAASMAMFRGVFL